LRKIEYFILFIAVAAVLALMYLMFDGFLKQVPEKPNNDSVIYRHDTTLINYGIRLDSIDRFHNRIKVKSP
jgi:hypothetical protein